MITLDKPSVPVAASAIFAFAIFLMCNEANALETFQGKATIGASIPREAITAAQQGLQRFLKSITAEELGGFNFSSQEEMNEAILGEPIRVYIVKPESVDNYISDASMYDIISPTDRIYFPVLTKSVTRTFLYVELEEDKWEAIGLGSSGLAVEWESLIKKWPSTQGYNHTFVEALNFTFVAIDVHTEEEKHTNIHVIKLGCNDNKLYDMPEFVNNLYTIYKYVGY
jgi:hypothetical protein